MLRPSQIQRPITYFLTELLEYIVKTYNCYLGNAIIFTYLSYYDSNVNSLPGNGDFSRMNITTSNITPQPTSFITAQYVVLHYLSVEQTPFRHAERFLPIMECNKETSSTCHRKLIIQMDLLPALFILHCLYSIRFHSELRAASGSFGRCF